MREETKISEAELDQLHRIEDKIARVTATLVRVMPDAKREVLTTVAAGLEFCLHSYPARERWVRVQTEFKSRRDGSTNKCAKKRKYQKPSLTSSIASRTRSHA